MARRARLGSNCYDQTRKLTLTPQEQAAGWSITICIKCENGRRRKMASCELCDGQGLIKVFDGDAFEKSKPGRPKKGRAA